MSVFNANIFIQQCGSILHIVPFCDPISSRVLVGLTRGLFTGQARHPILTSVLESTRYKVIEQILAQNRFSQATSWRIFRTRTQKRAAELSFDLPFAPWHDLTDLSTGPRETLNDPAPKPKRNNPTGFDHEGQLD